jgi:hypothetical protein
MHPVHGAAFWGVIRALQSDMNLFYPPHPVFISPLINEDLPFGMNMFVPPCDSPPTSPGIQSSHTRAHVGPGRRCSGYLSLWWERKRQLVTVIWAMSIPPGLLYERGFFSRLQDILNQCQTNLESKYLKMTFKLYNFSLSIFVSLSLFSLSWSVSLKGTQAWEIFWLRFWIFYYFIVN